MSIRILLVGDVVGRPGRRACARLLPELINELGAELVIVNAENAAGGFGLTRKIAQQLRESGADVITSGNHFFRNKAWPEVVNLERILRPQNFNPRVPGTGWTIVETNGLSGRPKQQVGVLNLVGRIFMDPAECPFQAAELALQEFSRQGVKMIVVDMHGEASSEKAAMGLFLDGRVSAVLGTHTHVQTADERLLPQGTAYLTDVGMTGPHDSVIGWAKEGVLRRMTTGIHTPFEIALQEVRLCGCVVEVCEKTGVALGIARLVRTLDE